MSERHIKLTREVIVAFEKYENGGEWPWELLSRYHNAHPPELLLAMHEGMAILKVANCPNTQCRDGAIPVQVAEDRWDAEQCQWCDEKDAAIARYEELTKESSSDE